MQTCYNCGKEVDDNVLICPECGALVKRYSAPVRDPEPQEPPGMPSVQAQPQQQAVPRGSIWRDGSGKLRLRGLFCAWLVVCVVSALYTALSFGCGLYLFENQEEIVAMFAPYPEFSQMLELLQMMLSAIGQFHVMYVLFLLVYLVKGAAYIWFMTGKRRLALYTVCGASAVLYVLMLLTGSGFSALWYVADVLVTLFLLRKNWKMLPK